MHERKTLKIERLKAASFKQIRIGADGSMDVVNECIKLITDINYFDNEFHRFAVDEIYLKNNLTSYSPLETRLQAVYSYVRNKVAYVSDIKGIEAIKDARAALSDGFGDCDDMTILVATLLGVLGVAPTLCIVKILKQKEGENGKITNYKPNDFNHIYCVHRTGDKVYILDTVLKTDVFNQKADNVLEEKYIDVYPNGLQNVAGVTDIVSKIGRTASYLGRAAFPVIGYLPIPFAGNLSQYIGKNFFNLTDDSLSSIVSKINANLDSLIHQVKKNRVLKSQAIAQGEKIVKQFDELIAKVSGGKQNHKVNVYRNSIKGKLSILQNA